MKISIIVAVADGSVIGFKNKLPWHIPEDLAHFKKITMGHHIVMGQKTYESVGKPLPGRVNIVLSNNPKFRSSGVKIARTIKEALMIAEKAGEKELMIVGGASVYRQFLPLSDKIYLTKVGGKFRGDTFFPEIDSKIWKLASSQKPPKSQKSTYNYEFRVLTRMIGESTIRKTGL